MKNIMMEIGWAGLTVMGAMTCLAAEPAARATLSMQPRSFALIEF